MRCYLDRNCRADAEKFWFRTKLTNFVKTFSSLKPLLSSTPEPFATLEAEEDNDDDGKTEVNTETRTNVSINFIQNYILTETTKMEQHKFVCQRRNKKTERDREKLSWRQSSVTRFGDIFPLLRHFMNLCQMVEGLFSVWQLFEHTLEKL